MLADFFLKGLSLLGLQCKLSTAHNPCNKHKHADISHISQVGERLRLHACPIFPISKKEVRKYSESELKEPGFVAVSMVMLQ